jgi:predicted MFS family arabinose efflux permease
MSTRALTGLVGSFLGGFIGMRYGDNKMGILVVALISALLVVFPRISAFWIVIAAYAITRLLLSSYMPLMNSMIADNSDLGNRSLAYSANFVAVSLATSLSTTATSSLRHTTPPSYSPSASLYWSLASPS